MEEYIHICMFGVVLFHASFTIQVSAKLNLCVCVCVFVEPVSLDVGCFGAYYIVPFELCKFRCLCFASIFICHAAAAHFVMIAVEIEVAGIC